MDNQHRKISGYRELNIKEIDLINEIKQKGKELGDLIEKINLHLQEQLKIEHTSYVVAEEPNRFMEIHSAEPQYWLDTGRHDMQVGIMKLVRSVAQPTDGM